MVAKLSKQTAVNIAGRCRMECWERLAVALEHLNLLAIRNNTFGFQISSNQKSRVAYHCNKDLNGQWIPFIVQLVPNALLTISL